MATPTGRIKIEGDAEEFKKMIQEVINSNKKVEKDTKEMGQSVGESFVTIANNALGLFEKVKGYVVGAYDHIKNAAIAAAEIERRDIAFTMLKRYNKEYFDITKNIENYTNGLMKSEEAIFLINKAVHRNIGLTKEQLVDVLQMSSRVAVSIGAEIGDVFDKISESVGKFETAPLEEIGIIIDLEDAVQRYARAQGKAAEEIDNLTKKEIVLAETRKRIKEGLTGTMSDLEFDIKTQLTKSLTLLDKSFRETGDEYNKFWGNQVKAINDFAMQEANIRKITYAKEREILKDHLGGQYKSWDEYRESQAKRTEIWNDGQVRIMTTYSQEYYQSLAKIKNAVDDFKKSMESKASFNIFYVGLQELKYQIKPITDQFNKLKESIWFLKDEPVKPKKTVDKAAIEAEWNKQFEIAKSYYDKLFEMEFEDYKQKEEWEKAKSKQVKIFRKLDIGELKAYSKEADKVLFNEAKEERLNQDLLQIENKYNKTLGDMAKNIQSFNNELFASIHKETMAEMRKGFMENATSLDQLNVARERELERFRTYAEERKLSEQDLALGIEEIKRRSAEKQAQIEEQGVSMQQRIREMGNNLYVASMNKVYDIVIKGQITSFQELLPFIMQQAGSMLWVEGTKNIGISLGLTANPFTAWAGPELFAAGLAQIALGGALGYAGNAMSSSSTSSSGASIENRQAEIDYGVDQRTEVYLFPSEKEYLSNLKKSMKKIGA